MRNVINNGRRFILFSNGTGKSRIPALLTSVALAAFNNKAGWKTDADGKLEVNADGDPIYIDSAGAEKSVGASTISTLNAEAKQHRTRAETAEASLKKYEGIDPEAAKTAIETVGKMDAKQLIDAGEVDRVKAEIAKGYDGQISERDKTIADLTTQRDSLTRVAAFGQSEFLKERIAVPADMVQATFGNNFKVEDGKLVPYGADGNKLYSPKRVGEPASVDEAFEILINAHPHKDMILKAPDASGSGNTGGGGNRGGKRTVARADFEKLPPDQQAATADAVRKGEAVLTD
jgi:hypothetical protein